MREKLKLLKRLILFFIGMVIIQIGVALFLKSDTGSDPFTVFNQGLGFMLNITTGNANRIILLVPTSIIFVANKRYINIGAIICVFGVGPIIDFALKMFSHLDIAS